MQHFTPNFYWCGQQSWTDSKASRWGWAADSLALTVESSPPSAQSHLVAHSSTTCDSSSFENPYSGTTRQMNKHHMLSVFHCVFGPFLTLEACFRKPCFKPASSISGVPGPRPTMPNSLFQARKRNPNLNFLIQIFSGGVGVSHVEGWGPKSSVCPSKSGKPNFFGGISRDFAGISQRRPKS